MKNDYETGMTVYIGKRLKEKRKKLGLTLLEIAESVGISHQQLQKYEAAQCRVSAETLHRIAAILGVDLSYFFQGFENYSKKTMQNSTGTRGAFAHKKISILIIEGDPQEEAWIRAALGVNTKKKVVYGAHRPDQAMAFLRHKSTTTEFVKPDILILSFDFPQQEGQWLLREVKRDRDLRNIPVIIVSHNKQANQVINAYNHAAGGYIHKSTNVGEFQRAIKSAVAYWSQIVCSPTGYVKENTQPDLTVNVSSSQTLCSMATAA